MNIGDNWLTFVKIDVEPAEMAKLSEKKKYLSLPWEENLIEDIGINISVKWNEHFKPGVHTFSSDTRN